MSVERVVRGNGEVVWRVRWREGSRNRSRVLGRKRDAEAFDAEVRRRRRTGELAALDAGRETLAQFAETWWQLYALPNLAPRTRASYAHIWDRHVLPRLGALPLREIDTLVVGRLAADLEQAGVGPAARRKALAVLSAVLQRAVEWGRLPANPARDVRSPSAPRARAVRPLPPAEVEAIREQLIADSRARDATLVSVLAYVGPRPAEALGLWEDVGERSLTFHATKTRSRRIRAAHLVRPSARTSTPGGSPQDGPPNTRGSSRAQTATGSPTTTTATGASACSRRLAAQQGFPELSARTTCAILLPRSGCTRAAP